MSITQPVAGRDPSNTRSCPHCAARLPAHAAFCSSCGQRIDKNRYGESGFQSAQAHIDMSKRYRITSLVRRRPYVSLFFAIDQQQGRESQQRMVAMRDIDISSLDETEREQAIELVQREYDLLRYRQIPSVMPVIDLHYVQDHIFVVSSWKAEEAASAKTSETSAGAEQGEVFAQAEQTVGDDLPVSTQRLYTLQDLLQSGLGLPGEERSLNWLVRLCQALDQLHDHGIVIGDLDPYTITLNKNSYEGQPALMVCWLLPQLRGLFPPASSRATMSYFSAPETLVGRPERRSDVYSLGAILYLLLTGAVPDVDALPALGQEGETPEGPGKQETADKSSASGWRGWRRRLRSPRELNGRISSHIDGCIMRALATDPTDRFESAGAFAEALLHPAAGRAPGRQTVSLRPHTKTTKAAPEQADREGDEQDSDTVRIVPLSQEHVRRWQTSHTMKNTALARGLQTSSTGRENVDSALASPVADIEQRPQEAAGVDMQGADAAGMSERQPPESASARVETSLATREGAAQEGESPEGSSSLQAASNTVGATHCAGQFIASAEMDVLHHAPIAGETKKERSLPFSERVKQWITNIFPSFRPGGMRTETDGMPTMKIPAGDPFASAQESNTSFLKQLQRTLLGTQRHHVAAAAIIETPLRVQPNQSYTIRIHLMGRDEPQFSGGAINQDRTRAEQAGGLSSLVHGETVHIEVRTALHQSYAYMVQRATVTIPAQGYAAEVTIPLQPLASGPSGRRDRLHIFFLDEMHHPLYEKPFVAEIFVSHLVQPGREGHAVLTIAV